MKKIMVAIMMLFMLIPLAACNDKVYTPALPTMQNENNQTDIADTETPAENLPAEELIIQIDAATEERLSTFANLHQVDIDMHGHGEGTTLVVWANQPLSRLALVMLESYWLEDMDTWGFRPHDNIGYVITLLPGEAYVIKNYMGQGTLPHRGISFFDNDKNDTRVFFFQENHAYPNHGGRWIIQEIETERLMWTWTPPIGGDPPDH